MVKAFQHLAGARCHKILRLRNFYTWLLICGLARDIFCADEANKKVNEGQTISTISSNNDDPEDQSYTEETTATVYSEQGSRSNNIYRFSRSVPHTKTTIGSSAESKSNREPDYILKIPVSVLRQYALHRSLGWEQLGEGKNYQNPVLRFGRSNNENNNDMQDIADIFQSFSHKQENVEENLGELFEEGAENTLPFTRNSRSFQLLLTKIPKPEGTTNEKPPQTFILPYPRPGRSDKLRKIGKPKHDQLILPYPRPGRSEAQESLFKIFTENNNDKKYTLPTVRLGRSSLNTLLNEVEDGLTTDEWLSLLKSDILSQKLNKELLLDNSADENYSNSFFIIPYPRPGKRAMRNLKNRNQNSKNSDKEMADYVLPYPRPGKKSVQSKETGLFFHFPETHEFSDAFNRNQNADIDSLVEYSNENEFMLPFLKRDKNLGSILPYQRPGRSSFQTDEISHLFLNDISVNPNEFEVSGSAENSDDSASSNFRFKRSSSVVPYPRPGRSNAIVPYPRPGRSNLVPYPRPGRSNSVVPYPRIGRSNVLVPYPRPGRSNSVLPYPRIGRSDAVKPHQILGQSLMTVPYVDSRRSKRNSSVVPYPRLGRSDSVVPYPRLGRSEYTVPYPRPGRTESVVPYPRPGRAESAIPYPRPGRAESIVPYPRPGRAESIVPYPRPGRSDSVVPYPRLGRSQVLKPILSDNYGKTGNRLLLNIPGRSNFEQGEDLLLNVPSQTLVSKDTFGYDDINSNSLVDINAFRENRATNGQGYVLPHPRVGRSTSEERKKRDLYDVDTVIPYPRLGRSQKETVPNRSPENQNSVHKLNKHVLSNVEDSVYLLPYPRPGRHLK